MDVRKLALNSQQQQATSCAGWSFALGAWFVVVCVRRGWRLPLCLIGHHKLAKHEAVVSLFMDPRVIGHGTPHERPPLLLRALGQSHPLAIRWGQAVDQESRPVF
jgi:hypothetical protein